MESMNYQCLGLFFLCCRALGASHPPFPRLGPPIASPVECQAWAPRDALLDYTLYLVRSLRFLALARGGIGGSRRFSGTYLLSSLQRAPISYAKQGLQAWAQWAGAALGSGTLSTLGVWGTLLTLTVRKHTQKIRSTYNCRDVQRFVGEQLFFLLAWA
jgi:hypothetical protein